MYKGRGAGRWAESSSGARGLPYKPPACARTAARRDALEGTRSLPWWRRRATAVAAVWTGMAKALRARPPLGQRSPPPRRQPQREGGGGRTQSTCAIDPVALGWGRLRPMGGDRRRGKAPLEMMGPKISGSDAGGSAAGGGEGLLFFLGGAEGGSHGAGGAPVDWTEVSAGIGPGQPSAPAAGGGENGSASPTPDRGGLSSTEPPW